MPKPVDRSSPAGVVKPVPVPGPAQMRIAHDAQDARKTGLQHVDNNHPNATAKHSQTHPLALPCTRETSESGQPIPWDLPGVQLIAHTSTAGWPPEALSTGK